MEATINSSKFTCQSFVNAKFCQTFLPSKFCTILYLSHLFHLSGFYKTFAHAVGLDNWCSTVHTYCSNVCTCIGEEYPYVPSFKVSQTQGYW